MLAGIPARPHPSGAQGPDSQRAMRPRRSHGSSRGEAEGRAITSRTAPFHHVLPALDLRMSTLPSCRLRSIRCSPASARTEARRNIGLARGGSKHVVPPGVAHRLSVDGQPEPAMQFVKICRVRREWRRYRAVALTLRPNQRQPVTQLRRPSSPLVLARLTVLLVSVLGAV